MAASSIGFRITDAEADERVCERLPYAVVCRVAPDGSIRVLAVAHHRRRPGYWRLRT